MIINYYFSGKTLISYNKIDMYRKLSGFINLKNYCYLNSALQLLMHNDVLVEYLVKDKYRLYQTILVNLKRISGENYFLNKSNKNSNIPINLREKIASENYHPSILDNNEVTIALNCTITMQLCKLASAYHNTNCTISPISFLRVFTCLHENLFSGCNQQDAEEAHTIILQKMHEELYCNIQIPNLSRHLISNNTQINEKLISYLKEESIINQMYRGFMVSTTFCQICEKNNYQIEPFYSISLPLYDDHSHTIQSMLETYCQIEYLDDDNLVYCENCQKKTINRKKISFFDSAKYLIIKLQRIDTVREIKNNKLIDFPKKLPFLTDCNNYLYTLIGVVYHTGSLNSGHYYSQCFHKENNTWFRFNDETIESVSWREVVNPGAYVLVYERDN